MENKPYIGIIGCGDTGRTLVKRLVESWHLLILDKDEKMIKSLRKVYTPDQVTCFSGDATSYSFLRKTNIKKAYQVLICIKNDEISNEIIHILQDRLMIHNIISQITDITLAENLKKKGVVVVYAPHIMVNFMINQMPLGQNIATYVGKGEGEIMQIQLTKSSPLVGLPLKNLPPSKWIVGAIYRPPKKVGFLSEVSYIGRLQISKADKMIIPRGSTIPQVGDKLLLIGDAHILKSTVQYLKAGIPVFPKRHGEAVISFFLHKERDISAHRQYQWLINRMEPSEMYYFYNTKTGKKLADRICLPKSWSESSKDYKKSHYIRLPQIVELVSNIAEKKRIGLIIYKKPVNTLYAWIHKWFLIPFLIKSIRVHDTPIWMINGKQMIRSITLFAYADEGTLRAAELAIDASLKLNLTLKVVQVNPPAIIAGEAQLFRSKEIIQAIREISALYGVSMQEVVLEGNPVKETLRNVDRHELLVLSLPQKNHERFLIPNSPNLIYKKFSGSMLVLAT